MTEVIGGGGSERPGGWRGSDRLGRPAGGSRTARLLAVVLVGVSATALLILTRQSESTANRDLSAPALTVVGGRVDLDTLDRAAALSLLVLNRGPWVLVDAADGLPSGLAFVPPKGGLPLSGGTSSRLPLAWPGLDCTTPDVELAAQLSKATLLLRNARAEGTIVALSTLDGAVPKLVSLRREACVDLDD